MKKQRMEENTMEEKKKNNPDSERRSKLVSAILMAFVCVMMMSGATYAWFTMSNTARVNSLKLNVAAEGNLYISKTNDFSAKKNVVAWLDGENPSAKTLYPCTTEDGIAMKKPIYKDEKTVGSVDTIADTEKETYYLEQKFYLLMDEGDNDNANNQTYSVHLVQKGTGTGDENLGTYFTDSNGGLCARVSFQLKDAASVAGVYEPNYNGTIANPTVAASPAGLIVVPSTLKQKIDGTFDAAASDENKPLNTGDSPKLFEITGDTATEVTIRVWFEGTDDQCCNEIALNEIVAQLKFVANKKTTTP